jgi:hypothetical protein
MAMRGILATLAANHKCLTRLGREFPIKQEVSHT